MFKKIVLVTGLWHPEVGGPVLYAQNLANYLAQKNFDVRIVNPGRYGKTLPSPVRFVVYFFKVLKNSFGRSAIYALDPWLCGISSFLVSRLLRTKYLMRLGGDTIWERWVFTSRQPLSLREFYKQGLHRQSKKFAVIKKVMQNAAKIIAPNQLLKDLYVEYYRVPEEKVEIIANPIPAPLPPKTTTVNDQIIYAGRLINLKNLDFIIRLFPEVKKQRPNLKFIIIGEGEEKTKLLNLVGDLGLEKEIIFLGKMPQNQLFEQISQSKVGVLASFSDCNPNFILECLSLKKPVLITKENGLTVTLDEKFLFDHRDAKEFMDKLNYLLTNYDATRKEIRQLDLSWSWDRWLEKNYQLITSL